MIARQSGIDYSQGIQFQTSIINKEEAKELTMNNQPKKSNRRSAGVSPSSTYGFPPRISLWGLQLEKPKNWPWKWRYLNWKQRSQQKIQQQRKRENVWRKRPLGRVKIRWGGISMICGVKSRCRGSEATEDGSWMGRIVLSALLLCWLDCIVSAGSYRWIVSYRLDWIG